MDISASHAFLRRVEDLDDLARRRDATAVLSVGLVPGLTNLLAKHCANALRLLRHRGTRETLAAILRRLRIGFDGFAVVAEAEGKGGRRCSCSAWGRGE